MKTFTIVLLLCAAGSVYGQTDSSTGITGATSGPGLIPATETMSTAWDFPRNPLTDSLPANPDSAEQIRRGFKIFTETPREARTLAGNTVSCNNCHLNAGQKERAMALVGISDLFPEYNKRAGRPISLEDRIVECFLRSSNATAKLAASGKDNAGKELLSANAKEVLAVSSYIRWLSSGLPADTKPAWRGQNTIRAEHLIPVAKLDTRLGKQLYRAKCVTCHGTDGQGVQIGDKKAGPLWGKHSWNDGAGAARVYTLAGIIRYMMPYLDPGSLTDEEAQHIAAYINSMPRPAYPFKSKDYAKDPLPVDAVYYRRK